MSASPSSPPPHGQGPAILMPLQPDLLPTSSQETMARALSSPSSSPTAFVVSEFERCMQSEPTIAIAVAAMQALTAVVKRSQASTMMGLEKELKEAIELLRAKNPSSISLASGCELFSRHVTRIALDNPSFSSVVSRVVARGEFFTSLSASSRSRIAASVCPFIEPGHRLLVHGFSRVVMAALRECHSQGVHFSVVTTEARPYCDGYRVARELTAMGVHTTVILDSAVAYALERIDVVLVGAEGVVESGGIINLIGTYGLCALARQHNKAVYVCAECYKFSRRFPLSQRDLPEGRGQQKEFVWVEGREGRETGEEGGGEEGRGSGGAMGTGICPRPDGDEAAKRLLEVDNPMCDYTAPQFLTLLFTDLGILTPSAVSDELIQLYA